MDASRLRKLRKEKGLSQKKLGDELGLAVSTIAMYETDKRNPDSETLKKIAKFFDVSTDYLLGVSSQRANVEKINKVLSDDPELSDFWNKISKREDLQQLFKQAKNYSPKTVKQAIRIIKAIENGEED